MNKNIFKEKINQLNKNENISSKVLFQNSRLKNLLFKNNGIAYNRLIKKNIRPNQKCNNFFRYFPCLSKNESKIKSYSKSTIRNQSMLKERNHRLLFNGNGINETQIESFTIDGILFHVNSSKGGLIEKSSPPYQKKMYKRMNLQDYNFNNFEKYLPKVESKTILPNISFCSNSVDQEIGNNKNKIIKKNLKFKKFHPKYYLFHSITQKGNYSQRNNLGTGKSIQLQI